MLDARGSEKSPILSQPLRSFPLGKREMDVQTALWKVCREEEDVSFQVVSVSPLCGASGMAPPAQALSFGISFHPHSHPTEDPVVTTTPPQHNQSSERVCDEFKVTELENRFLLTMKLFSLPENSAN